MGEAREHHSEVIQLMSIIYGPIPPGLDDDSRRSAIHFVYGPLAASECFYCARDLGEYPVVQWVGAGTIFLHPRCAQDLALRLAKDGLLAETESREVRRP